MTLASVGARAEDTRGEGPPSCGRQAWSGRRSPPASCRTAAYLVRVRQGRRRRRQHTAAVVSGERDGTARHDSGVELCAARAEAAETDGRNERAVELARLHRQRRCHQRPLHWLRRRWPPAARRLAGWTESERPRDGGRAAAKRPVPPARPAHRKLSARAALHQRLPPELEHAPSACS